MTRSDLYVVDCLLDLGVSGRSSTRDVPDPRGAVGRRDAACTGGTPGQPPDIFAALDEADVLIHHPYDRWDTTVGAFVDQAADDPDVLAIKQTMYRTSDGESPIVHSLIRAAASGKQAVALVELTARGDEEANIAWARTLEKAGVHVVYGVVGLKTHAKTILVVRQEGDSIRRYCHIGTGNYNPETAKGYEDIGLLDGRSGTLGRRRRPLQLPHGLLEPGRLQELLVAPVSLRRRLLELIREEAGAPDGRIVMKMNSLVDTQMIDALYDASAAGADIDLVVRGICCLKPGVPGLSERIRVRSIVGRYLEHSRIFRFGSDARGARYYLGSADLMPRNLDRRVECVTPVTDPALTARLAQLLDVNLADDVLAWELGADGWTKVPTVAGVDTHERLKELAVARALRGD